MSDVLNNILYQAFAEASDYVYIYVTDVNEDLTRWSKNAVDYFGLPGEYIKNVADLWIERVHPDDREAYLEDLNAVFEGRSSRHSCQYRVLNCYNEYVWVECKGSIMSGADGQSVFAGMLTRLDSQSIYDPLTGLLSINQLYEYDFQSESGAVLLLGVDNFRNLINTYGYNVGNEVLIKIGKLFAQYNTVERKVYRFNGDEFVVVLPNGDENCARTVFQAMQDMVRDIPLQNGRNAKLTFSAGAILYPLEQGTKDDLINKLEVSLDYVKRRSKGTVAFFSEEIEQKLKRTQLLKSELKNSILNNFEGFELYYQPWMNAQGTKIAGCEALLRWKGQEIKDAGPGEFIPILEESDDIIEVGRFVMREAMKQQKLWEEKYGEFIVSFNVSYRQFLVDNYVEELEETAREYGVNPKNMVIELTESCSVQAPLLLATVFERLRGLGFKIALDDFGTGYASMDMLKKLPSDGVKIEHSFVRELEKDGHDMDFAIIEAILLLCSRIGREVVVEGVENHEVDSIVRDMKVNYLQGYYYSRPICKDDFEKLVKENFELA